MSQMPTQSVLSIMTFVEATKAITDALSSALGTGWGLVFWVWLANKKKQSNLVGFD